MQNNSDDNTDPIQDAKDKKALSLLKETFKRDSPAEMQQAITKITFSFINHQCNPNAGGDGINKDELNAFNRFEALHDLLSGLNEIYC
jgi:hypothetical protein